MYSGIMVRIYIIIEFIGLMHYWQMIGDHVKSSTEIRYERATDLYRYKKMYGVTHVVAPQKVELLLRKSCICVLTICSTG